MALLVAHKGEEHGRVEFALFGVSFVAPAGASFAMIRAVRTRVALPGLLLRGPVVEAVAELISLVYSLVC